jgi:hypothetical protein
VQTFEGRCGKGKVVFDFDPPQSLTVKVTCRGDCPVDVSFKDKTGKTIQIGGKDSFHVEADKKQASAPATTAAHVEIACGAEPKKTGADNEQAAADKRDCVFDYEISSGDCNVKMELREKGATWDKKKFTDYDKQLKLADGTIITATAEEKADLGALHAKYDGALKSGAVVEAEGFFTKVEFEIDVDAPCKIVDVARTVKTLADNNARGSAPDGADGPAARSKPLDTPQRVIVTDAPGFIADTENPDGSVGTANKIYHKEFTITATIEHKDGSRFKQSTTYEILIKTDDQGKRKR